MGFKAKIFKSLTEIHLALLDAERFAKEQMLHVKVLQDQVEVIQQEKAQILDRLMSQNFEKFKLYSSSENITVAPLEPVLPEEDEDNAGTII